MKDILFKQMLVIEGDCWTDLEIVQAICKSSGKSAQVL